MSWEKTVALADVALYLVKKGDRDGWCLIQPKASMVPEELIRRLDGDPEGLLTPGDMMVKLSTSNTQDQESYPYK